MFRWILEEVAEAGYLSPKAVFIDGTHIKANTNTKKQVRVQSPEASKHYAKELMEEVKADRQAHGKKPFDDDDEPSAPPKKRRDNTSKKKLARRKKEKLRTVTLNYGDTVLVVDNSEEFAGVAEGYWGENFIDFAVSRGLFAGTGEDTFSPETAMSRAMIVTVLASVDGVDTAAGSALAPQDRATCAQVATILMRFVETVSWEDGPLRMR